MSVEKTIKTIEQPQVVSQEPYIRQWIIRFSDGGWACTFSAKMHEQLQQFADGTPALFEIQPHKNPKGPGKILSVSKAYPNGDQPDVSPAAEVQTGGGEPERGSSWAKDTAQTSPPSATPVQTTPPTTSTTVTTTAVPSWQLDLGRPSAGKDRLDLYKFLFSEYNRHAPADAVEVMRIADDVLAWANEEEDEAAVQKASDMVSEAFDAQRGEPPLPEQIADEMNRIWKMDISGANSWVQGWVTNAGYEKVEEMPIGLQETLLSELMGFRTAP